MIITCKQCKKEFKRYPSEIKGGENFCSRSCTAIYLNSFRKNGANLSCVICNKTFYVKKLRVNKAKYCSYLCLYISRKGRVVSQETRRKQSEARKREKHPLWIKDRSKVKGYDKRNNPEYKQWVNQIKKRDGECRIKNKDCKGYLEVHHILDWSNYPELRYKINNGITLCQAHHPKGRAEEKRLAPVFQELVSVSSDYFCQ